MSGALEASGQGIGASRWGFHEDLWASTEQKDRLCYLLDGHGSLELLYTCNSMRWECTDRANACWVDGRLACQLFDTL